MGKKGELPPAILPPIWYVSIFIPFLTYSSLKRCVLKNEIRHITQSSCEVFNRAHSWGKRIGEIE